MPTRKPIKALCRKLIDGDIYHASRLITNPRSQGCPRFQSGEELANNVGKINAHYSL